MAEETKNISVRIPAELYDIIQGRLDADIVKGKKVPLKTKGRFRDPRLSDIVIDMLADAVIKDEQSGSNPRASFVDRFKEAIWNGESIKVRVNSVGESMALQDFARANGYKGNGHVRTTACKLYFTKDSDYHTDITCGDSDEYFEAHRNREIERD